MSSMLRFGCGHVEKDEAIHEASWGARLIFAEVKDGASGVVWDRQTPDGEPDTVRLLFPVIERATAEVRPLLAWQMGSDSRGRFCWRDGRALVVMSPQGSYGYLYVTAVLEREGHEGETRLRDFEDGANIPLFGNWPPEMVAEREAKEREAKRAAILDKVYWTAQEARWAQRDVWGSKTERTRTIRQKKADRLTDEAAAARAEALALGFTEEECDSAVKRYGF